MKFITMFCSWPRDFSLLARGNFSFRFAGLMSTGKETLLRVLPYKGLMGTCGKPGYVFRDFCLEQGIEFIIFCLNQGIDLSIFVLNWVKCLKQGIKNRNSVLNRVGKSAISVLNRVRV